MIAEFFYEGTANYPSSPSYKSVENIRGVVSSVITRVQRNPEILSKPKRAVSSLKAMLDGGGLDKRTSLSLALVNKEYELVEALGGDPSPQQRALIADTVKTLLYIGSLDDYLSSLKSVVRKGKVHNVLIERTRLATHLKENLRMLGLRRRMPPYRG